MTHVPPPPAALAPPNIYIWSPEQPLYRVARAPNPINAFNPGNGRPSRFAPMFAADGTRIPTLYVGSSMECAVHEAIFRDVWQTGELRSLHFNQLQSTRYGRLKCTRALNLVMLHAPDLAKWGLTREQLVHTAAADYLQTARWAEAIHRQFGELDGLAWTSHRCDPDLAMVLFGDRVQSDELVPVETLELPQMLDALRVYGHRAGLLLPMS